MKLCKELLANQGLTPDVVTHQLPLPTLLALSAPDGKISKEQAMDIINKKREAKGLKPIHSIP